MNNLISRQYQANAVILKLQNLIILIYIKLIKFYKLNMLLLSLAPKVRGGD